MLKHLRCENGFKFTPAEALGYIHLWGKFFGEAVEYADDIEAIEKGIAYVNKESGLRCVAAEMLVTAYCHPLSPKKRCFLARAIADCAQAAGKAEKVEEHLRLFDSHRPGLGEFMRFYVAPGAPFNIYQAQNEFPSLLMLPEAKQKEEIVATTMPVSASETLKKCRSQGQRTALAHLSQIACVRHQFGAEICGIPIRAAALLIGLSGSGKTFVAKAFAAASGWPVWETTAGGWSPNNAVSQHYTLVEIAEKLAHSPLIIFIDEIDKVRSAGRDTANWWRCVITEIMMLLDGNMGEIKLTGTQKGNLARSWILTAGAFQDIFKEKMGPSVDFVEQVTETKITREEMENLSGLPTELLNRVGHVIHVASPTPLELALAYEEIETATGHKAQKKSRDDAARDAVIAMKGFRGLEEYALSCAREVLLKNAKGAK